MKIPKDKLNEKGEYSLKDDEDFHKSPKEPKKPSNPPMTDAEYEKAMKKFIDSVRKEIKKSLK